MPLPDDDSKDARPSGVRASKRVNARIPVAVEWEEDGHTFRKEGYTLDVGGYGCLVVVPQDLSRGQSLRLTNLINNQSSKAVITWKGEERSGVWEFGMTLVNPDPDFWDLEI